MFNLLKKDLVQNKKYFFLTMIVVLIGSFLLLNDQDIQQYYVALYFLPLTILNMIIGKLNYIDDQNNIRLFLKSLPYSKYTLVGTRYLETMILIIVSIIYSVVIETNYYNSLEGLKVIEDAFLAFSVITIYQAISLWMFFYKNYRVSQNALVICCILLLMFYGITNSLGIVISININYLYIIISSICVYILSFYMSSKMLK